MSRKVRIFSLAGLALVAALALSGLAVHQQAVARAAAPADNLAAVVADVEAAPAEQAALAPQYVWSYSAKFVCGYQSPFATPGAQLQGEPIVKPGNYATEINIHNPQYREVKLFKKVVLLVDPRTTDQNVAREPRSAGPVVTDTIVLKADYATLDDCNRIYSWISAAGGLPSFPPPLMIGYLVILSRTELDVDAVYTANAPGVDAQNAPTRPTGISIDVERVTGKRILLPTSIAVLP